MSLDKFFTDIFRLVYSIRIRNVARCARTSCARPFSSRPRELDRDETPRIRWAQSTRMSPTIGAMLSIRDMISKKIVYKLKVNFQ